jgi:hypothetical protein
MSGPEKISFVDNVMNKQIDRHYPLSELIEKIRGGEWKDDVEHLRKLITTEVSKQEQQSFKRKQLPVFYPSVFKKRFTRLNANHSAYATGVVQFDVDYVVDDIVVQNIRELSELVYLFKSPSGGLKFGLMTDFSCVEIDELSHQFRTVYQVVKRYVEDQVDLVLDDSMSNISQGCYVSYDPDALYNDSPEVFSVQEGVDDRVAAEEVHRSQQAALSPLTVDADDDEVLRALSHIPHELNYEERQPINISILVHFGVVRGKQILMGHWVKSDQNKLAQQIDGYCQMVSSGRSSNGVTISTLFHHALKYGFRSEGINKKPIPSLEPTYNSEIYSKEDAEKKVDTLVSMFFDQSMIHTDSMGVLVEAGLGKTEVVIDRIVEQLVNHPNKKIAYYVPTHKLGDEIANRVTSKIEQKKVSNRSFKNTLRYSGKVRVQNIKGRKHYCTHPFQQKMDELNSKEELSSPEQQMKDSFNGFYIDGTVCQNCSESYYCKYVKQFSYQHNLRIYSSDYLLGETASYEYGYVDDGVLVHRVTTDGDEQKPWKPDFVVVDEDVVSKSVDKETPEVVEAFSPDTPKVIKDVFVEYDNSSDLMESIVKHASDIVCEKMLQDKRLKEWMENEYVPVTGGESINELVKKLDNQTNEPKHYQLLGRFYRMFRAYQYMKNNPLPDTSTTVVDESVWVKGPNFLCGSIKPLNRRFRGIPILYLDASGDESVIKRVLRKNAMEFHSVRVQYQRNVTVKQVYNSAVTRSWMNGESNQQKVRSFLDRNGNPPVISYMKFSKHLNRDDCGWFGNIRGSNHWNESDRLVVVGREKLHPEVLEERCRKLYGGATIVNESEYQPLHTERIHVKKVVRMRDGNHQSWVQDEYGDYRMQSLSEHFEKGETYQALHRLRLIHGSKQKELLYISNEIVDLTVDKLVDVRSIFKDRPVFDKRIEELVNAINKNGALRNTNKILASVTALSNGQIAEMKRQDDFIDVVRGQGIEVYSFDGRNKHRKRVTGEVFVGAGNDNDDVVRYLESQGFNAKSLSTILSE